MNSRLKWRAWNAILRVLPRHAEMQNTEQYSTYSLSYGWAHTHTSKVHPFFQEKYRDHLQTLFRMSFEFFSMVS